MSFFSSEGNGPSFCDHAQKTGFYGIATPHLKSWRTETKRAILRVLSGSCGSGRLFLQILLTLNPKQFPTVQVIGIKS